MPIDVRSVSLRDVIKDAGGSADIVKFDIEGAESDVFRDLRDLDVQQYIGEVHPDLMGVSVDVFEDAFRGYEISRRKLSGSRYLMIAERRD